jgi:coenzyme F420-reducing hydrogenase alpha subunit
VVKVDCLARVEGEGALHIKLKGDRILELKLKIPEPPRLFEAFLRGRHFLEAPDITARICGICPIAYQMSSVHAIENALGVPIDPAVRALRRLFYCGEWIESHALHVFLLHAPDFLGCEDAFGIAASHRDLVADALRLKKAGNTLVSTIGGREIHPVAARVGGFWKTPSPENLQALAPELEWAYETAARLTRWVATLPFPDFSPATEYVALSHPEEYPMNEGRIVSTMGLDISAAEFEDHFLESHVRHSNALHCQLRERGSYQVGPVARLNLNFDKLPESIRALAAECGILPPIRNPFQSIYARMIETTFACYEALRIIQDWRPPAQPYAGAAPREATGCAITEAPRGILFHRYVLDSNGLILSCRIIPPTSQNLRRIEDDLWQLVPPNLELPLDQLTWRCEQAVRNYDPCISCATHFLRLNLEREP